MCLMDTGGRQNRAGKQWDPRFQAREFQVGRQPQGWRVLGGQQPVQLGLGVEGGGRSPGMPGGRGGLEPRGWAGRECRLARYPTRRLLRRARGGLA